MLADPVDLELVVVDQSTDDSTVEALVPIAAQDPRLRVVCSPLRGASNARNVGVAETTAPLVAFTDDDCRPQAGWASTVLRVFDENPDADLVFGRVWLPPKENESDYVGSFEPIERIQERVVPLPDGDIGIGANFRHPASHPRGARRIRPLARPRRPYFRGAEETDLLIRGIASGHRIINARECDVLHLGVRTGDDVRPLHVQYQFAVGAAFGKHVRLSGWRGLRDATGWVRFYLRKITVDTIHRQRPPPRRALLLRRRGHPHLPLPPRPPGQGVPLPVLDPRVANVLLPHGGSLCR